MGYDCVGAIFVPIFVIVLVILLTTVIIFNLVSEMRFPRYKQLVELSSITLI